ncbi:MAG: DUF2254 domain-containing protein, partial [Pseudomonadota bacterium]|nr:DUF2254 domain-containing protein [Pseudomonadota bacterium]
MTSRLRYLLDRLLTSYWFVPAGMVAMSIVFAALTVRLDMRWQAHGPALAWLLVDGDNASQVLAVIAGSMISITGVVYSMTLVALSLAASQYGAKLLRQFMKARANQVVLGTFTGTFVYSVLVLRMVNLRYGELDSLVPHVSTHVAIAGALVSLACLIYFIHTMSRAMQAEALIAAVAGELDDAVVRWTPPTDSEPRDGPDTGCSGTPSGTVLPFCVTAHCSGYVQSIDYRGLAGLCAEHDLICEVLLQPGSFVIEGQRIMRYGSAAAGALVGMPEEAQRTDLDAALIIGAVQTPVQDIEYSIDQLVQLALRALSPGINDPMTAMTCIDWLVSSLVKIGGRGSLPSHYRDAEGVVRVLARPATTDELADRAFDPIRQYGCEAPQLTLHAVERLAAAVRQVGNCAVGRAL